MEPEQLENQEQELVPLVENLTPQTQQVQIPETPSTDSTGKQLYLSVIGDKNREIERLQKELEEKNKPAPAPPIQNEQFFAEPATSTRQIVQQELAQALAPLQGFVAQFTKNDAYATLKASFKKTNPVLGASLAENESAIDQMLANAEPTEGNLLAAIAQIEGLKKLGLIQNQNPAPASNNAPTIINNPALPVNPNPASMSNPPHLRPSAPAAPVGEQNKAKLPPLSENERRLMRELGMTEEEYRAGQAEGSMIIEPPITPKASRKPKEEGQ